MALAYSFSPAQPRPLEKVTVTLTGLTPTTAYQTTIKRPSGGTQTVAFTSDGSGNATFTYTDSAPGVATFDTMTPSAVGASAGTSTFTHGH